MHLRWSVTFYYEYVGNFIPIQMVENISYLTSPWMTSSKTHWLGFLQSCSVHGVVDDVTSSLDLWILMGFTVHYLRWCMPPFMHQQCWGLPHRLAQCMRPQEWGKLVNAALLSLINETCVNVCCATVLSSELFGPTCVQARSSNPRGRACRPSGKGLVRRGYWVMLALRAKR